MNDSFNMNDDLRMIIETTEAIGSSLIFEPPIAGERHSDNRSCILTQTVMPLCETGDKECRKIFIFAVDVSSE